MLDQVQHTPAGDAGAAPARTDEANRWPELDVAARLRWSAAKAGYELRYAFQLVRRLPVVHAALAAEVIDRPRARVIVDGVACLEDEPARQVAAQVLAGGATDWNPRRLADQDPPPATGTSRSGFAAGDVAFPRARDRTCRGPQGCHTPASTCDVDHTVARADGGGHHRGNGGSLCRREHLFKHQSGATLRQPEPGVFEWITPLGYRYTVRPEPYDESTGPPLPPDGPRQRLALLFRV